MKTSLNDELHELGKHVREFRRVLLAEIAPYFNPLLNWLNDLIGRFTTPSASNSKRGSSMETVSIKVGDEWLVIPADRATVYTHDTSANWGMDIQIDCDRKEAEMLRTPFFNQSPLEVKLSDVFEGTFIITAFGNPFPNDGITGVTIQLINVRNAKAPSAPPSTSHSRTGDSGDDA